MRLKNLFIASLLAGACAAAIPSTAHAVAAAIPDLLLCFRVKDNTGQGAGVNLEVDLGTIVFDGTAIVYTPPGGSAQTLTPGQTIGLSSANGLAAQDLRSIYGDGSTDGSWNTRSTLAWSVSGTNGGAGANTLWVTSPASLAGFNRAANQSGPGGRISTLYNAVQGTTVNSSVSVAVPASQANSYSTEIRNGNPGTLTKDYNYFAHSIENGVVNSGTANSDLYQLAQGSGAGMNLGTFALGNDGSFTFTTAVPEPSLCAMMVGGGIVVLLMRHRWAVKSR